MSLSHNDDAEAWPLGNRNCAHLALVSLIVSMRALMNTQPFTTYLRIP